MERLIGDRKGKELSFKLNKLRNVEHFSCNWWYFCLIYLFFSSFAFGNNADNSPKNDSSSSVVQANPVQGDRKQSEPLNYETLGHKISVILFRAGSHDDSGISEYYFNAELSVLNNTSEERNKDLKVRKKVTHFLGAFGDINIEALAFWKEDPKKGEIKMLEVSGKTIRENVARAIRQLKVNESDLSMMIEVSLFKKQKKFYFLGDDVLLSKVSYFLIPETKFDVPLRKNQELSLTDEWGTVVKMAILFQ